MNKITKIISAIALTLLVFVPEISFAYETGGNCGEPNRDRRGRPERYEDYMNRCRNNVDNQINNSINQLRGQAGSGGGVTSMGMGMYMMPIGRQQDVFTFCKYGMNTYPEMHFWKAINPSTGTFTITNYYYVNMQYIPAYVLICPFGGQMPGNWQGAGTGGEVKGNTGPQIPLHVPFIH